MIWHALSTTHTLPTSSSPTSLHPLHHPHHLHLLHHLRYIIIIIIIITIITIIIIIIIITTTTIIIIIYLTYTIYIAYTIFSISLIYMTYIIYNAYMTYIIIYITSFSTSPTSSSLSNLTSLTTSPTSATGHQFQGKALQNLKNVMYTGVDLQVIHFYLNSYKTPACKVICTEIVTQELLHRSSANFQGIKLYVNPCKIRLLQFFCFSLAAATARRWLTKRYPLRRVGHPNVWRNAGLVCP